MTCKFFRLPILKLILNLFFVLWSFEVYSQQYAIVDQTVKSYPKTFAAPQKLAEKINADFAKDEDKARAIFTWMALNIQYDLAYYASQRSNPTNAYSFSSEEDRIQKEQKFKLDAANKTLRSKKGVCQDYAALFQTLCELMKIQCTTIIGKSKNDLSLIGRFAKFNDHAWNAVKIGNAWQLLDVTWAASALNSQTQKMEQLFNDGYFFTAPEVFFLNHFPEDKQWLFLNKTESDFANLPLYYGGYIKAPYQFITPLNGLFSKTNTQKIMFKAINFPENYKVAYVFSSEGQLRELAAVHQGNTAQFEVVLGKKSRGYLTIYVNNESIVSYKIVP